MVTGCCDVAQKVSTNVKIESEKKKFENFLKNAFLNSTFSNVAGLSFELFSNPFFLRTMCQRIQLPPLTSIQNYLPSN